jgi:hypothetical protein
VRDALTGEQQRVSTTKTAQRDQRHYRPIKARRRSVRSSFDIAGKLEAR